MLLASYIEIHIFEIILLSLLLFQANKSKYGGERFGLKLFNIFVIISMIMIAVRLGTWLIHGQTFAGAKQIHGILALIEVIFDPAVYLAWLVYTDYKIYGDRSRLRKVVPVYLIPFAIDVTLSISNIGTGILYTIDNHNVYHRSGYIAVMYIICYLYALMAVVLAIAKLRKSNTKEEKSLCYTHMMFAAPTAIGGLLQLLFYGTNAAWSGLTISIVLCYIHDQLIRLDKTNKLEHDLNQSQISLMLSQIRPHFLYNSLVAIEELCHDDAEVASEAVREFAFYLRNNLDSLSIKKPIPFNKELSHVENYLSLEKKRFGEKLKISYDIHTKNFMIPALTLQPVVENAVRHGVTKREEGGAVSISVMQTKDHYVITVADDGVGYDLKASPDDQIHVGIQNVKSRLRAMSGGDLTIDSKVGVGTTAIITIPKKITV